MSPKRWSAIWVLLVWNISACLFIWVSPLQFNSRTSPLSTIWLRYFDKNYICFAYMLKCTNTVLESDFKAFFFIQKWYWPWLWCLLLQYFPTELSANDNNMPRPLFIITNLFFHIVLVLWYIFWTFCSVWAYTKGWRMHFVYKWI